MSGEEVETVNVCQCLRESCYEIKQENKTMNGEVVMGGFYNTK